MSTTPAPAYLAVDGDHLEDGRFLLRPTGVGLDTDSTNPGDLAENWQATAPSLEPSAAIDRVQEVTSVSVALGRTA